MTEKKPADSRGEAETRNRQHTRERLADMARAFKKDPRAFVGKMEEATPAGTQPAAALLDAAIVFAEQGQFRPALSLLERAADLYEEQRDMAGLARVYVNMGPLYGMLDDLDKGVRTSLKAEELAAKLPADPELKLHYASDLGGMYTELEEWAKAMKYFQLACDTARSTGNHEVEADALLVMSQVAIAKGDAAAARTLAEHGGRLGQKLQDKQFQARSLQTLGDADALEGKHEQALELFKQALDLEAAQPDAELRQQLLWEMSEASEELGRTDEAAGYREQAAELGTDDEDDEEDDEE